MPLLLSSLLAASLAAATPKPPLPPVRVLVPESTVVVTPGAPAEVEATLTVHVVEGGPIVLPIADVQVAVRSVTVDGTPAGLLRAGAQLHLVGRWDAGVHTVVLSGAVRGSGDADTGDISLWLPPGAHTRVAVAARADQAVSVDGTVAAAGGLHRARPESNTPVRIAWRPKGPAPARPRTVHVDQQTVVTVDDALALGRARIDLRVENGRLDQLPLHIPGGTESIEVLSPPGATAIRSGSRVVIQFSDPVTDVARVEVRYRSAAASEDAQPVPIPRVDGTRGTHAVALLRGDDAVVIPEPDSGAEATAFADLPDGMDARLPGTPVAAFTLSDGAGLTWRRLETTPAAEPPVLIDHALYEASFAESGTGAIRATWQVRNDRAPFLRIQLPSGWSAVSARVAGRSVPLSRDGDTLLVPLEKSTETMVGRVQLPVELSAIGPGTAWVKRGWHDLIGPTVDAPVSHVEWQVTLPPSRSAKKTDGARRPGPATARVDMGSALRDTDAPDFDDDFDGDFGFEGGGSGGGGPMGFSSERTTSTGKKAKKKKAKADRSRNTAPSSSASQVLEDTARKRTSTAYWSAAYDAYKDNDFDRAEQLLDKSQELDPDNFAAQQLQSNIAVLNADTGSVDAGNEAVARRVKAMARAKSGKTEETRQRLEQEAKEAERSGDLERAAQTYRQLVQTTSQLASLEEDESVEEKRRLEVVQQKLDEMEQQVLGNSRSRLVLLAEEVLVESEDEEELEMVAGGVPGGVVGGFVGGVMGGALGGRAAPVPNAPSDLRLQQPVQRDEPAPSPDPNVDLDGVFATTEVVVERNNQVIASPPPPPPPPSPATGDDVVIVGAISKPTIDFEDLDIRGELVKPQGALLLDRKPMPEPEPILEPEPSFDDDETFDAPDEAIVEEDALHVVPGVVERSELRIPAPRSYQAASQEVMTVEVRRRPVRGTLRRTGRAVRRAGDAVASALHPPERVEPPRPPLPDAAPGMTPLPTGVSAARGDVALPVDPERLLHVEQQLLPADTAASFRVQLRPDRS